jgi:nicotinate-nucleotide adenylyltransferase
MNLAIFGGSFDPPHIGHEQIVYKVLGNIRIDKFIIVPTFLNPFKNKYHLEPQDRFELLNQLFNEDIKVEVSDFEVKQNKAVQSIETINYYKEKYKPNKIYLILGADNLEKLPLWDDFKTLNSLVTFIIISRDGYEEKNDIIQFINIKMDIKISSTKLRNNLDLKYIPLKIQQKVKQIWKKEFNES